MKKWVVAVACALLVAVTLGAAQEQAPIEVTLTFTAKQAANLKAVLKAMAGPVPEEATPVAEPTDADVRTWVRQRCLSEVRSIVQRTVDEEARSLDLSNLTPAQREQIKQLIAKMIGG